MPFQHRICMQGIKKYIFHLISPRKSSILLNQSMTAWMWLDESFLRCTEPEPLMDSAEWNHSMLISRWEVTKEAESFLTDSELCCCGFARRSTTNRRQGAADRRVQGKTKTTVTSCVVGDTTQPGCSLLSQNDIIRQVPPTHGWPALLVAISDWKTRICNL